MNNMKSLLYIAFFLTFIAIKVNGHVIGHSICSALTTMIQARASHTFTADLDDMCCILTNMKAVSYDAIESSPTSKNRRYGLLRIESGTYCGINKIGGKCKANCKDFIDDNKLDDITCAQTIINAEGLGYWPEYKKYCQESKGSCDNLKCPQ